MCICPTFYVVDLTSDCKIVTIWLSYQPPFLVNIWDYVPFVEKITKFEISDFKSITNIEMVWASEGYFFPVVDVLVWKIIIEEEGLHFVTAQPNLNLT